MKFLTACLMLFLCLGFQAPSTQPVTTYRIVQTIPSSFPLLPTIPWPPVRAFYQNGMIVQISPGGIMPNMIRFKYAIGFSEVPITQIISLGNNLWRITTPIGLTPHVLSGVVGIRVHNTSMHVWSNRVVGRLP